MALNQIDRRAEALSDVDQAVALRPDDLDILNARVIVLDNLGQYTDALSVIDRMLALNPKHVDAVNNCGMVLARIGRFHDALSCCNRSLSLKRRRRPRQYVCTDSACKNRRDHGDLATHPTTRVSRHRGTRAKRRIRRLALRANGLPVLPISAHGQRRSLYAATRCS
jgi:tetratricopeptide (TPR) repeat protein